VCQVAHFVGDDCKPASCFTGTCRFNRSVQRQQVGLLGNAGDHFENLADVHGLAIKRFYIAAGGADHRGQLSHRLDIALNHLLTVFGQMPRIAGLVGGLRGITRDFLSCGAQFIDGSSHAVGAVGLFVGVDHRRVGCADYPQCYFIHLLGGRGHFADGRVNTLHEAVERITQDAELIVVLDGQATRQVTFAVGDVLHGAGHHMQRLQQDANQHAQQGNDDHYSNDRGDHR